MICARYVFKLCKWLNRCGDALTGAAGPVFVTLAIVLLSVGAFCFFEVILPSLPWLWLSAPLCILIAINLFAHYFWVVTVPPGFVTDFPPERRTGWVWAKRRRTAAVQPYAGVQWSDDVNITKASVNKCRRCGQLRPERAHHCRVCNACVLKYDHHCPCKTKARKDGINQCVGLYNERHFVMFLIYLSIASLCYSATGWPFVLPALGWGEPWQHRSHETIYILLYILAVVMCLAVSTMTAYHVWSIACGETSCESLDHEQYRKIAKGRGEDFINSYDLGKLKNLELFFNIGKDGYPTYTLFLPFRIEPYTDGRSWARRPGFSRHQGIEANEELTDEEDP